VVLHAGRVGRASWLGTDEFSFPFFLFFRVARVEGSASPNVQALAVP
jgi:hypothetical protein